MARRRRCLQAGRDLLGLPECPQQVDAEDLPQILLRVAALCQNHGELRELRHVLEPAGHDGDAVEVRSQAHVVDAGHPHDMLDVVSHDLNVARLDVVEEPLRERLLKRLLVRVLGAEPLLDPEDLADPACRLRDDETREEIDHHHAAVSRDQAKHVVGHVPGVIGDRPGRRVREDDGSRRRFQRVAHDFGSDVGQVDEHAEPVHLVHDLAAERRESAVQRRVAGGIRPGERLGVGQRQVARARTVELPQHRERVGDGVPTLDADERRDPAGCYDPLDVLRREGDLQVGREGGSQLLDEVDLLERHGGGSVSDVCYRDVGRPELDVDPPFAQSWDVRVTCRLPGVQTEGRHVECGEPANAPRKIVVSVHDDGVAVDPPGRIRNRVRLSCVSRGRLEPAGRRDRTAGPVADQEARVGGVGRDPGRQDGDHDDKAPQLPVAGLKQGEAGESSGDQQSDRGPDRPDSMGHDRRGLDEGSCLLDVGCCEAGDERGNREEPGEQ